MTPGTMQTVEDLTLACYDKLPSSLKTDLGTCTHLVYLLRKGGIYAGIYNGLSCWGKVYSKNLVEELFTDWVEEEDGPGYHPNFSEKDFEKAGYQLVKEIASLADVCKYPLHFSPYSDGTWLLSYHWRNQQDEFIEIIIERINKENGFYQAQYFSKTRSGELIRFKEVIDEQSGDDLSFVIPFLSKHGFVK